MQENAIRNQVNKFIATWTEMIHVACQLVSSNATLKSVASGGKKAMDEFLTKQGSEKLKVVIGLRRKITSLKSKLVAFAETEAGDYDDFLKMTLPTSFETELDSEHFDDLAGHLVTSRASSLESTMQTLGDAVGEKRAKKGLAGDGLSDFEFLLQWSPEKEAWWKGLPEGASLDLVDQEMNKTIFNIPALPVQKFCKDVQED